MSTQISSSPTTMTNSSKYNRRTSIVPQAPHPKSTYSSSLSRGHSHGHSQSDAHSANINRRTFAVSRPWYSLSTVTRTSYMSSSRSRIRRPSTHERLRRMYRDFAIDGIVLIELDADLPQTVRSLCFPNVNIYLIPDHHLAEARAIAEFHGLFPSAEFSLTSKPPSHPRDLSTKVVQYTTNHIDTPSLEAGRLFLVPLSLAGISEDVALPSVPLDANTENVCPVLRVPLRQARIVLVKIIMRFMRYQRSKMRKDYAEMLYKCVVCAISSVVFPKQKLTDKQRETRARRSRLTED